ncbi:MAG TPA: ATP-binding protein [Roseiarcus sp.]|nr:ATP-binding protein [Roseiarcus sp.]
MGLTRLSRLPRRIAMAPFAVAAAIVLAIVVLALAANQLRAERDMALDAAAGEVGARATLLAARLDAALSAAPQASPAEIFRLVLDAHPDERLAQAVFLDRAGLKIAIDPPTAPETRLSGLLSAFASAASPAPGVVRFIEEPGYEHFAAIRPLAATGGRVAFASPVAHRLAAWSRAERTVAVLAAATVALILTAGALLAAEQQAKPARDGQARRAELMADETSGAAPLVAVAFDVTDGKRGTQATIAGRRLKEAISAISDAFVQWDSNRRLVLCNSKYRSLHNLLGRLRHAPSTEAGRRGGYEAQLADGRWLQTRERRMCEGGSGAVAADITAVKEDERQLINSKRLLTATASQLRTSRRTLEEQSRQLADLAERYQEQKAKADAADLAKAEFLANMSHELRTPLNAIIGFSQLMGGEAFGPLGCERYREYCSHILDSGRRLLSVVSDILDMSRLEAGRERLTYACVSADQAARRAADDVAAIAREKGVALKLDVRPDLSLEADSGALDRILVTLMRNAVKFAPAGGSVEIGAEAAGEQVYFYVQDDGPGVAEQDVERLTRPFEQGVVVMENGMKGSGLGLAIAKSLAELHGGTLRLAPRPGKGAIAVVTLPRAPRAAHSIVLAEAA